MARVIGAKQHSARLQRMAAGTSERVGRALFAAGNLIQVEAQLSISRGAVSGKGHVPSRPGEPPNYDTGVLANNIETAQVAPLKVTVTSNAPYSAALEYGSSGMGARPYMGPAVQAKRAEATALVRRAVSESIR